MPEVPRVLVIGLDPFRVPGPWEPEPVAAAIAAGLTRFADHGIGVETCLLGLDGSDDMETVVTNALRAQPWECVVIGGGVRTDEDQLELFERLLNLVRHLAPQAAIAFDRTPTDRGPGPGTTRSSKSKTIYTASCRQFHRSRSTESCRCINANSKTARSVTTVRCRSNTTLEVDLSAMSR
jgi:hypothetical protein